MRVKELKQFLNNVPDDTEIFIRCQLHEKVPMGVKEYTPVASITPHLNDTKHEIIFNADKLIRLTAYQPEETDLVMCESCVRASRIFTCSKRDRDCDTCKATCDCKLCGHFNITEAEPFSNKPKYERNLNFQKNN